MKIEEPIFFEKNRVSRVYRGGLLLGDFFGDASEDCDQPEEWIASSVCAWGTGDENEGISIIEGSKLYFKDLLKQYKDECLGERDQFDILVKILDSAIRLPAQVHPDKAFSKEHFHSPYGKTESWVILGTRENACLYFGFQDGVNEEVLKKAIDDSMTDRTAMEKIMCKYPIEVGDVYLIPARTVHAIGAGCLILEIQEPTDFTIEPEHWCGETKIPEEKMYLGLDRDTAISCFQFEKKELKKQTPMVIYQSEQVLVETLIGARDTDCFCVNRLRIDHGSFALSNAPAIYVVTDGEGVLNYGSDQRKIKKGDFFFLPHILKSKVTVQGEFIQLVECY